jgi:hypothetical protein
VARESKGKEGEGGDEVEQIDLMATKQGLGQLIESVQTLSGRRPDVTLSWTEHVIKTHLGLTFNVVLAERTSEWATMASVGECKVDGDRPLTLPLPHDSSLIAYVATVPMVFAIKRSQVSVSGRLSRWQEHIEDVHALLAALPDVCRWDATTMDDPWAAFVAQHRIDALSHLWSMANLIEMDKKPLYDQGALREVVAYGARPLCERLRKDPTKAMIDRDLFEAASEADKLRLVREECMAVALGHFLLPARGVGPDDEDGAYALALGQVCTTLPDGWLRDFAASHYPQLRDLDVDLVAMADTVRACPAKFAHIPTVRSVGARPPSLRELPALDARLGNDIFLLDGITDIPPDWLDEGVLPKLREILALSQSHKTSPGTHSVAIRWLAPDAAPDAAPDETIFTVEIEYDEARRSGETNDKMLHVKASFDEQVVLEVTVEHRRPVDERVTVDARRLVVGPSVVPFGLFLATCFHLADANSLLHDWYLRANVLNVLNVRPFDQVPGFASLKNWATVWERQDPVAALTEAVPFHRHIELRYCANWGELPERSLDTLRRQLSRATHATSAALQADGSPQLLALAAALPSSVVKVVAHEEALRRQPASSWGNWQKGAGSQEAPRERFDYYGRLCRTLRRKDGTERTITPY